MAYQLHFLWQTVHHYSRKLQCHVFSSFLAGHAIGYAAYHVTFMLFGSTTIYGTPGANTCSSETMFLTLKGSKETLSGRKVSQGVGPSLPLVSQGGQSIC